VLLAIREHKITPVQAKWLQKFQWQNLKSSYGQGLLNDMSVCISNTSTGLGSQYNKAFES
jgi:hypothetical protein